MKLSKNEFAEVYENYIKELINQQAQLVIEINNLIQAVEQHSKDVCLYHLNYDYNDETGVHSYTRGKLKKIGF